MQNTIPKIHNGILSNHGGGIMATVNCFKIQGFLMLVTMSENGTKKLMLTSLKLSRDLYCVTHFTSQSI